MSLPIVEGVEFRAIEDWPGYAVGDDGSVWSCFQRGTGKLTETWRQLKPVITEKTEWYTMACLKIGKRQQTRRVHRMVLEAFIGPCPDGLEACHNNGIRSDARLSNLRWDTSKNNMADKAIHGTTANGERIGNAKLTAETIKKIRELWASGMDCKSIGKLFGVSGVNVGMIVKRKTWKHVA